MLSNILKRNPIHSAGPLNKLNMCSKNTVFLFKKCIKYKKLHIVHYYALKSICFRRVAVCVFGVFYVISSLKSIFQLVVGWFNFTGAIILLLALIAFYIVVFHLFMPAG
jgi:hypothetical protein